MSRRPQVTLLLAGASVFAFASGAHAQTSEAPVGPAVAPAQSGSATVGKRVYTPADFARFAPKTSYDVLKQIPGFTIRTASEERGLGQASENVLINGQRVANKSGGAVDQLQNVSVSSVERIEIVDAASLGIAGLSGQVANVILKQVQKSNGQFEYNPSFRAHYAKPSFLAGSVSYNGKSGPLDYTLSARNDPGRGAFGGPIWIYDADGVLTETREEIYRGETEQPVFQAKLGYDGPASSLGNVTVAYQPYWNPSRLTDDRQFVTGETQSRSVITKRDGYKFDANLDYEFAVGPGRLKLIGVRRFEHEPLVNTLVDSYGNGAPSTGDRFDRDTRIGETIARGEFGWRAGGSDWQLSLERAFNSLDQKGRLFALDSAGEFVEVDYPQGTGKVTEIRYEAVGTLSRALTPNLDAQLAAGGEISELDRVDDDQPARRFFRPKGSLTLGWRPAAGWDASLKLRRRVGQISFYDFLSQPKLSEDRENAGNPNLVPPQSWEVETEVGRDLRSWGKTRLNFRYQRVEDIIDVIPIGIDEEGIGNLPRADRFRLESVSTFQLDPLGWAGAKIDLTLGAERTSVRDPLTGEKRPISGIRSRWLTAELRHDIPGTQIAWTAYLQHNHYGRYYYLTEVSRELDLPWMAGVGIEHKNLLGLSVRLSADNIFNGRHLYDRLVYEGYRDRTPVSFRQKHDQLIGPIFTLSVRGSF